MAAQAQALDEQSQPDQALLEAAARQSQEELAKEPKQYIPGIDNQLLEAAARQSQFELKSPIERVAQRIAETEQIPLDLATHAATNILGMPAAAAQAGAAFQRTVGEAPNLQGLSIDQVKAQRADMQGQLDQMNRVVDGLMKSGAPDDQQIYAYNSRINSFEARIKEADSIIAGGKPSTAESKMVSPAGTLFSEFGKRGSAPAMEQALQQIFPTNQDFKNSLLGQIAYTGTDIATIGALSAAAGPMAATGFMASQMGEQIYQAKKDQGASDEEAERAGALTSLASASTMGVMGPTVDYLAKSFSGMTAKQGIQAIMRANIPTWGRRAIRGGISAIGTGTEFGLLDIEQQAIGRLQGYDPNRPLDHLNWWNIFMGAGFGAAHGVLAEDPRLAREIKPQVTTRNKQPPPAPAAPPPVVPTEPTAAAPTAAPQVTTTDKTDPVVSLNRFADDATKGVVTMPGERGFELGAGAAPAFTGQARPAPTTEQAAQVLSLGAPPSGQVTTQTPHPFAGTGGEWREVPEGVDIGQRYEQAGQGAGRQIVTYTTRGMTRYADLPEGTSLRWNKEKGVWEYKREEAAPSAQVTVPFERQGEAAPRLPSEMGSASYKGYTVSKRGDEPYIVTTPDGARRAFDSVDDARAFIDMSDKARAESRYTPGDERSKQLRKVGDTLAEETFPGVSKMTDAEFQTLTKGLPPEEIERASKGLLGKAQLLANLRDREPWRFAKEVKAAEPEAAPAALPAAEPTKLDPQAVRAAYDRVQARQPMGGAVHISDLANELGVSIWDLHDHLRPEYEAGRVMLDDGHAPTATDEQKAGAMRVPGPFGMQDKLTARYPEAEAAKPAAAKPTGIPVSERGEILTEGSPQFRLAVRGLVNRGMSESEARQRVLQTPTNVQGGGAWQDVVQTIVNQPAQAAAPAQPVTQAPQPAAAGPDPRTALESHAKSLYTTKGDRTVALVRWTNEAERQLLQTDEGFQLNRTALEHPDPATRQAAQAEIDRRVWELAAKNQGLGDPNSRVTGYEVRWEDHTEPETSQSRFQRQRFTSKKDAQQQMRELKRGRNFEISIHPIREPKEPKWYGGEQPAATRLQNFPQEPVDRPVSQDDVKREVQTAQADMGMHDSLVYYPTVEDLPDHVKAGLSPAERNSTAQIVIDHKLGTINVIGDRFTSLNELRRAIIEEAIPYRFRNVSRIAMKHDPTDRDLGTYDHISDNPELNTHALLSAERPYQEAMHTTMEELNVHQGINKLLGLPYGRNYINAMDSVQSQFDRLKLNDILAQKKGYANVEEMAKAYLEDRYKANWRDDPALKHKMTEELIGAYSRTFSSPEELAANGPSWYQNALRGLQNGIRRYLGLEVSPYDVQSLLHDSAAALRSAKAGEPSDFHPIGDQAKLDMQNFRMANRMPTEEAPGAGERVDITGELVRGRIAELQQRLQQGQQLREQPIRLAMRGKGSVQERLNLLNEWPAVISHEGQAEIYGAVLDMLNQDFGGDANTAIQYIMDNDIPGAKNAILADVVGDATRDKIDALHAAGEGEQADILAARLDRMNAIRAQSVTEMARGLAAQKVLGKNGSSEVGQHKTEMTDRQQDLINRKPADKTKIDRTKEQIDQAIKEAAQRLMEKANVAIQKLGATIPPRGQSVPEQYLSDLVNRIQDAMFKTNTGFGAADKPALQRIFDTFRQNIQQIINERTLIEKPEKPPAPKATDTLRTIMDNYPSYKEAWARTMDMLYNQGNPELAQRFDRAIEEPVGTGLANKLALEQGQNLKDLIFDHFSKADRITTDLASKIVRETGMSGTNAQIFTQYLQNIFSDIIKDEQEQKLDSILNSVGGNPKKAQRGELGQLVDHIVIGGLDSDEWLNLVAPRFGLDHVTPEQIETLRKGGDYMSFLRSNGLQNSPVAQQVRTQIGDIMRQQRIRGQAPSKFLDNMRYAADVYTAGLLTSVVTHAPYFQQALLMNMLTNTLTQVGRALAATKGQANMEVALGSAFSMMDGFARGLYEFMPIMRGIKPQDTFLPEMGEKSLYSGPMEKVTPRAPTNWGNIGDVAGAVGSQFARYKYVRNALDAISNLMTRGSQYATAHAMAMKLVWEDGLRGQAAWDVADRIVLGSPEQRARAFNESHSIVDDLNELYPDRPVSEDYRKMLEGHLLDEAKTTSQNPQSTLAQDSSETLRDLHRRAMAPAVRGALRNDVPGMWGQVSQGFLNMTSEMPALKLLMPFNKTPFNLINELLAWTPIGVWRSMKDLVPPDSLAGRFASEMPGMRTGIRGYLEKSDVLKQKIASGEISEDQIRDLAWEQMTKGALGTAAGAVLGAYAFANRHNPNAPLRFTHAGPSNYGQQQIERGKGWQPNSVYFNGEWHSYENTPWRAVLAAIGSMEDAYRYDKTEPDWDKVAFRTMAGGLASVFGSPLQGPQTAMSILSGFGETGGIERKASDFAAQAVAAMISTPFGGTMTRHLLRLGPATEHPAIPGLFDPTQYYPLTPMAKFLRYVPVVNAWTGEPKLNVFGEHMYVSPLHNIPQYSPTGGLGLTGLGRTVDPNDPVWNYLDEHPGLHIEMPGSSGSTAHIMHTPEEQYVYQQARGPRLKEFLAKAFADPHFVELPEAIQNKIIQRTFERAATRTGQIAVMKYRQDHPVDIERIKQSLTARGRVMSEEMEQRMTGITEEQKREAAQRAEQEPATEEGPKPED